MNSALSLIEGASATRALPAMGAPASSRRWTLVPADLARVAAVRAAAGCSTLVAEILAARGVAPEAARAYLNPSLREQLPNPSVLADLDRASIRLASAIANGDPCGVFGDYDVDGACAAAMLKRYFDALGAPLDVYLPDRILEGYGPTVEAFAALRARGARVIITVDCGAAAYEAVASAAGHGVDVVILDHHQMQGPPPKEAVATVNPHRPDDTSGLTDLSAAGVVFMTLVGVTRALRARGYFAERREPDLLGLLDLAALGLVCDVMPMTGLARVMVAQGLKALAARGNPGLAALAARAGAAGKPTAYDLGFVLGPRINAAGRIGHARLAFELLTTADAARRDLLAEKLHVMNAERQEIERAVEEAAIAAVGEQPGAVIVAAGEGWHPGVVGIVAGRLKDRFDRPAVVIGVDGAFGKGSARSIEGVDIGRAIRRAKEAGLLVNGGGHAMAAGVTLRADDIGRLRDFLVADVRDEVDRAVATRSRRIDAVVGAGAVSRRSSEEIALAGPYGPGNPEPTFVVADMRAVRLKQVGRGHLAATLSDPFGETVRAIAFRAAGEPLESLLRSDKRLHVAGRIKADDWAGGGGAQLHIVDAAPAA